MNAFARLMIWMASWSLAPPSYERIRRKARISNDPGFRDQITLRKRLAVQVTQTFRMKPGRPLSG